MRAWLPVLAWAAVIFGLSSISSLSTDLGTWDLLVLGLAHAAEYAVLGALLVRALRRPLPAIALGALYAVTDEIHQTFVYLREGSVLDALADTLGVAVGVLAWKRLVLDRRKVDSPWDRKLAVDLDALGDTRPLWDAWLADASRVLEIDPAALPADRAAAAAELDATGVGNWRTLLVRYSEDRAPVYLRTDARVADALRGLQTAGTRVAVFTDAPEELADLALLHLGAGRRVDSVHAGADAESRAVEELGDGARVVRTRADLLDGAAEG